MKQNGMIAFFDILGYQNIIINNDIEKVANIINDTILELPSKVQNDVLNTFTRLSEKIENKSLLNIVQDNFKRIDFLIISDSILIFLPIEESIYEKYPDICWMTFLLYCCVLLDESFKKGLPLRGAIEYGEYYKKEKCFAGKSIIEGYTLSNKLEFSGCVLCENAHNKIKACLDSELMNMFVFEYLAPLNNNSERKLFILNWVAHRSKNSFSDIRQFTLEAFHTHNKEVPVNALSKLNNTENIIRYCLMKNTLRNMGK